MSATKITIESAISADVRKVWNFWSQPEHIVNWNFASDDWCCPKAENDLRTGGKFKYRMEAKDGSFGFDFEGTYDDVVELKRIAYTMPDGRRVVTTFEDLSGKTKVMTVFDADATNPIEMQKQGWQSILNNFRKYVESK